MKTFSAMRWVVNEIGRIHWSSVRFQASGFPEAETLCNRNGWRLEGELIEEIAAPEMDAFGDHFVRTRNQEWLYGGIRRILNW